MAIIRLKSIDLGGIGTQEQSLKKVYQGHMGDVIDATTGVITEGGGHKALVWVYYINEVWSLVKLDVEELIDEKDFKDGLYVSGHSVYVKIDSRSEDFLTVGPSGVSLNGVQIAIDSALTIALSAVSAETQDRIDRDIEIYESGVSYTDIAIDAAFASGKTYVDNEIDLAFASGKTYVDELISGVTSGLSELSAWTVDRVGEGWANSSITEVIIENEDITAKGFLDVLKRISGLTSALTEEVIERESGDTMLWEALSAATSGSVMQLLELSASTIAEIKRSISADTDIWAAISAETEARKDRDVEIYESGVSYTDIAFASGITYVDNEIDLAFASGITYVDELISGVTSGLTKEIADRESADTIISSALSAEVETRIDRDIEIYNSGVSYTDLAFASGITYVDAQIAAESARSESVYEKIEQMSAYTKNIKSSESSITITETIAADGKEFDINVNVDDTTIKVNANNKLEGQYNIKKKATPASSANSAEYYLTGEDTAVTYGAVIEIPAADAPLSAGTNIDITNSIISVSGLSSINGSAVTSGGNIVLTIASATPSSTNVKEEWILADANGNAFGSHIKIYNDGNLHNAYLGHIDDTIDETSGAITSGTGATALGLIYINDEKKYKLVLIDVSKFLEETEFADGLKVENHIVSVKKDTNSEDFLSVSADGVKISGVTSAITMAVDSAFTSGITYVDNAIASAFTSGKTYVDSAITSAMTIESARTEETYMKISGMSAYTKDIKSSDSSITITETDAADGKSFDLKVVKYSGSTNIDITDGVISLSGMSTINGSAITSGGNLEIIGEVDEAKSSDSSITITSATTASGVMYDYKVNVDNKTLKLESGMLAGQYAIKSAATPSSAYSAQYDLSVKDGSIAFGYSDSILIPAPLSAGSNIVIDENLKINVSGMSTINGSAITSSATDFDLETVKVLTQAEYDALTKYDPKTTYVISDASAATIITMDEVNSAITSAKTEVYASGKTYVDSALTEYTKTTGFTTVNGSAITVGGNIQIDGKIYSAGTNINIDSDDKINVTGLTTINGSAITNGGNMALLQGEGSGVGDVIAIWTADGKISDASLDWMEIALHSEVDTAFSSGKTYTDKQISAITSSITSAISAETVARIDADNAESARCESTYEKIGVASGLVASESARSETVYQKKADMVNYYTSAQTDTKIGEAFDSGKTYTDNQISAITSALSAETVARISADTVISSALSAESITRAEKDVEIYNSGVSYTDSAFTSGITYVDSALTEYNKTTNFASMNGVASGLTSSGYSYYAPTTRGTFANQPLLSSSSGAPVWGTYSFEFLTQAEYDALTTKDLLTIYFIVD